MKFDLTLYQVWNNPSLMDKVFSDGAINALNSIHEILSYDDFEKLLIESYDIFEDGDELDNILNDMYPDDFLKSYFPGLVPDEDEDEDEN